MARCSISAVLAGACSAQNFDYLTSGNGAAGASNASEGSRGTVGGATSALGGSEQRGTGQGGSTAASSAGQAQGGNTASAGSSAQGGLSATGGFAQVGNGGALGSAGGNSAQGGKGGSVATGGANSAGGEPGGSLATGGVGGAVSQGGSLATGGVGIGGGAAQGGSLATGGSIPTGGSAAGGVSAIGGTKAAVGGSVTGGTTPAGGSSSSCPKYAGTAGSIVTPPSNDFESNSTGWVLSGSTSGLSIVSAGACQGSSYLACDGTKRLGGWAGPAINVLSYLTTGHVYTVTVAARFDPKNAPAAAKPLTFTAAVSCTSTSVSSAYAHLQQTDTLTTWTRFSGPLPTTLTNCTSISSVTVYMETNTSEAGYSIDVDDFQLIDTT